MCQPGGDRCGHTLVLNLVDGAQELLDKRAIDYSDYQAYALALEARQAGREPPERAERILCWEASESLNIVWAWKNVKGIHEELVQHPWHLSAKLVADVVREKIRTQGRDRSRGSGGGWWRSGSRRWGSGGGWWRSGSRRWGSGSRRWGTGSRR